MKGTVSNSQELRREIQTLAEARDSLDVRNDISGSIVKINNTLNSIKPLMTRQTDYIKTFLQATTTNDSNSKQAQTRRYFTRISDINLNEMTELLSIGQSFFSIEIKNSWNKLKNEYQKILFAQKEQSQKSNVVEFLFRLMNMKDKIIKDFIKSLIYRKCLLWKDLNINNTGYVHCQKKKLTKLIEDYILNKKYAPTKPFFNMPQFSTPGQWSLNKMELQDSPLSEILKLLNEQVEEAFSTVRNYSGLNEQQRNHEDIRRNKETILSLRAEIEQSHINYQQIEKKYRQAINKDEKLDMVQLKQKFRIAEEALDGKEQELRKLKFEYRDYTANMNAQKQKIKELETDFQRVTNVEMKKLKEVELLQFSLTEEVSRISKNMNSFGTMFEFESEGKKGLAAQIITQKETIEKMAVILGRHKNDNHKLKDQIARLNLVILELGLQIKNLKNSNYVIE